MSNPIGRKRTDSASRVIEASPQAIYRACINPEELLSWLPPKGMKGRILGFDARAGGAYRMSLTYLDPAHATQGKTADDTDIVDGRFVELVPDERVIHAIRFQSDDPAFAGEMIMTWSLEAVPEGTKVTIVCENVPEGIRKEDHDAGLKSSLDNLAEHVMRL